MPNTHVYMLIQSDVYYHYFSFETLDLQSATLNNVLTEVNNVSLNDNSYGNHNITLLNNKNFIYINLPANRTHNHLLIIYTF